MQSEHKRFSGVRENFSGFQRWKQTGLNKSVRFPAWRASFQGWTDLEADPSQSNPVISEIKTLRAEGWWEVQSRWEILSERRFKMYPWELVGGGVGSLYGEQQKYPTQEWNRLSEQFKAKHRCRFSSIASKRKGRDTETSEVPWIPLDFGLSVKEHTFQTKKYSIITGRGEQKSLSGLKWMRAKKGFCKENGTSEWLLRYLTNRKSRFCTLVYEYMLKG